MKNYRYLTKKEEAQTIIEILDVLFNPIEYSGKHRKEQWEKGWGQNLKENDSTPHYFGKYLIQRLNGKFILAFNKNYEITKLHDLVFDLSKKYFKGLKHVYEFGCGTGHNLPYIELGSPFITLHGLDWATSSQKILKKKGIDAHNFDFFNPGNFGLKKNSGVITVAALEQTGKDYLKFVKYLLKKKPSIVVHIEPIPEMLNPKNLIDYLSIKYMEKRKYLSGYLDYLTDLEDKGKIKILESRRSGVGSLFVDGYSIIVWKPL